MLLCTLTAIYLNNLELLFENRAGSLNRDTTANAVNLFKYSYFVSGCGIGSGIAEQFKDPAQ